MNTILIIDDEPCVLSSLQRTLKAEGYDVRTASDDQSALRAIAEYPCDLVLCDYRMPGMNGVALLSLIKEKQPDAVRIILSGHADLGGAIRGINHAEVYRFLTKPWDSDDLRVTIRQALNYRDLLIENRRLADEVRRQRETIDALESQYPGIAHVKRCADGAVLVEPGDC
jgi:DNA-binding NtrC family response regulator